MLKKYTSLILVFQLFFISISSLAEDTGPKAASREFALPSEFEGIRKEGGAFYYSPTSKGKVLVPINVWGEVNKGGLHFVPTNTDLIQGLSLAGGPKSTAALDKVKLIRNENNKIAEYEFDLSKGGNAEAFNMKLDSGDTIFIEKEFYYENRAYYTGLFSVIATVLSSVILYRQIKRGN